MNLGNEVYLREKHCSSHRHHSSDDDKTYNYVPDLLQLPTVQDTCQKDTLYIYSVYTLN